jgi:hypothetical protein
MKENRSDVIYALLLERGPLRIKQMIERTGYAYTTTYAILRHPPFIVIDDRDYAYTYGLECHLSMPPREEAQPPAPAVPAIDPALADMICDQVKLARAVGVLAQDGDAPLTAAMFVRWQQQRRQVQAFLGIRYDNEEETHDHTNE